MKPSRRLSIFILFAVLLQLFAAPSYATEEVDPACREALVPKESATPEFPFNLALLSQKWKMKFSSPIPFEVIAYAYHSSQDPAESAGLMKTLGSSFAVLTQKSPITGMGYVQQMKDDGFLDFIENPADGRSRIPVITARASQRYIDFLVENDIDNDAVDALLKFQMKKWRFYRSSTHLTLVLFVFQQILSQPEGVGPDVIVNELLNQTDLSQATGKLMLRHLVADDLVTSIKSPTNGQRRNYVLTAKGENLLRELRAAFQPVFYD